MIRVYSNTTKDFLKIFKKKVSYDGKMESYKRKQRFLNKRRNKELKRIKKHAFIKHLRNTKNMNN